MREHPGFSLRRSCQRQLTDEVLPQYEFAAVHMQDKHWTAHLISQESVPKSRFLTASPQGEAFGVLPHHRNHFCLSGNDTHLRNFRIFPLFLQTIPSILKTNNGRNDGI